MDALTEKVAGQTQGSWKMGSGGFDSGYSTPSCLRGMTVLLEELDGIRVALGKIADVLIVQSENGGEDQ